VTRHEAAPFLACQVADFLDEVETELERARRVVELDTAHVAALDELRRAAPRSRCNSDGLSRSSTSSGRWGSATNATL